MAELGLWLKREREERNITLEEIASSTKIGSRYLEALEADQFEFMPGGFFIKGIIRTYARYIGLDEDEVLSRYRAAGVLGERAFPPRPAAAHAPSDKASPPSEAPPSAPPFSPSLRKRLFYWFMVAVVIILALALVLLLWTTWRPKPAPEPFAGVVPATEPPQASAQASTDTSGAREPAPPPPIQEEWRGITMEMSFKEQTWLEIYADGLLKAQGLYEPDDQAKVQADTELLIHVGNAGGFTFLLNGRPAKPLGRPGTVIKDIRITVDNYKDFLQDRPPDPPA